jgi:hypothetical protein
VPPDLKVVAADLNKRTREAQGLPPQLTDDSIFHLVASYIHAQRSEKEAKAS